MNYPAGTRTGYLNTCCLVIFFCFLCGMNKKSTGIIPRSCCFQLCVKLRMSTTVKELVYMTHSLQEYKSLVL